MTNPLEQIRELLPELMSACEMIGYATMGKKMRAALENFAKGGYGHE